YEPQPPTEGPWTQERLWDAAAAVPYCLPPVGHVTQCPAGLAYYPGTGLPDRYAGHFFLCDFYDGLLSLDVQPRGAGFELGKVENFLTGRPATGQEHPLAATDVAFGPDGAILISDWASARGDMMSHRGRIFRVTHPLSQADPSVAATRRLLAEGMKHRSASELAGLLSHADQRIRQAAQFALAERGLAVHGTLTAELAPSRPSLSRIHAIWA